MYLKRLVIGLIMLLLKHIHPGFSQDEDTSSEDQKIIEILDILESLDILEEDLEILQNLGAIGDDDEE
jgi:hypothetical protein